MRISRCFLALLFLISLPVSSQAGEAPSPAPVLPFAADSSLCLEDAPPASMEQPDSPPAVLAAIGLPFPRPKCGACSTWDCKGITLFTQCANGKPYSGVVCVDIGVCTADGSLQCDCRQAM